MEITLTAMIAVLFFLGVSSILYSMIYEEDFIPIQYIEEKMQPCSIQIEYMIDDIEINEDTLEWD